MKVNIAAFFIILIPGFRLSEQNAGQAFQKKPHFWVWCIIAGHICQELNTDTACWFLPFKQLANEMVAAGKHGWPYQTINYNEIKDKDLYKAYNYDKLTDKYLSCYIYCY